MRAGRLNKKVIIQRMSESRDSMGGVIKSWSTFANVWASIDPLMGKEYFASKQVNSELSAKIRIRYLSGINFKMRILHDDRVFNINSIINVYERDREIILMCTEDTE